MNQIIRIILVQVLIISNLVVVAQNLRPIQIGDDLDEKGELIVGENTLAVLEDKRSEFNIHVVQKQARLGNFKVYDGKNDVPYFNKNITSTYWLMIILEDKSSVSRQFLMESYSPHTEVWNFYEKKGPGSFSIRKSGLKVPFEKRDFENKNLVFGIHPSRIRVDTVYIEVYSPHYRSSFDFRIKPVNKWTAYSTLEYHFLGIFYGIILIMTLYNTLLFTIIREKIYLYFTGYMIVGAMVTSFDDGIGNQFIWHDIRGLATFLELHVAPLLFIIFFLLYARKFLTLKESSPSDNKAIIIVLIGFVGYHLLHFIIKAFYPEMPYFRLINIIPPLTVFTISVRLYRQKFRPARYFIVGSFMILCSAIVIQLRAMGLLPGTIFTVYSLNFGLVGDILFFSIAHSERIKFIKNKEQKAQEEIINQLKVNEELREKVNRELEQKVSEKTQELNANMDELNVANQKLQFAINELNALNVNLDLDNWNLRKTIKAETERRLTDSDVSYNEFQSLFPDKNSALRRIEEIKWGMQGNQFRCRRCGAESYNRGPVAYSKKCSSCNYAETATANTLFHGVRFPINKAVYLTYMIIKHPDATADELSHAVDLRRNTCWAFKKKVLIQSEIVKKRFKLKEIDKWEQLVHI